MSNLLLFPLSAADQGRIVPGSITVSDEYLDETHALKLTFTIGDPQNGAPQIRPLWPGGIDFRPDPAYPGARPQPQALELTHSAYETWAHTGTLRAKVHKDHAEAVGEAAGGLEAVPNCIWYFPVKLSEPFLFSTIGEVLGDRIVDFFSDIIEKTSEDYAKNAISWFLNERYAPVLDANQRLAHPMPTVHMSSTGAVTLYLATALSREPQDGSRRHLAAIAGGRPESDPSHPMNASLPPRRVLQKLSVAMENVRGPGNALLPLAQAVLEPPAFGGSIIPLRFRRAARKVSTSSCYFPAQRVVVRDAQTDALIFSARIPHHGVVYFKPATAGTVRIRVKIIGGMRCLKGDDDTQPLWREKATGNELEYEFAGAGAYPEIILRRPMSEEIFTESADATTGRACTYHSMRRTLRALANNRIAGGRLNYGVPAAATHELLREALGAAADVIKGNEPAQRIEPKKDDGAYKTREEIDTEIGDLAAKLKPVWSAFFPTGGKAYSLWQSSAADWYQADDKTLKASYVDIADFRGRGAPGALAYLGLATGIRFYPPQFEDTAYAPDDIDGYAREMTQAILSGLEPGALLQFWHRHEGFEILAKHRGTATERASTTLFKGHSPIFVRYLYSDNSDTKVDGIRILDQNGEVDVKLESGRLNWRGRIRPELWIGANWKE